MLMAEDQRNFVQAMQTEVEGLKKILKVIRREDIPAGNKALPAMYMMADSSTE
jgi:hypothetical protein